MHASKKTLAGFRTNQKNSITLSAKMRSQKINESRQYYLRKQTPQMKENKKMNAYQNAKKLNKKK